MTAITGGLGPGLPNELAAPVASPALTGTPTAPTATALTDNTQLATTAYADNAVAVETSRAETAEALKAPIASPTFTGTPASVTPALGDDSTNIATTAYVAANSYQVLAHSGVASSHTGDTSLTTLGTFTIPAGRIGNNGSVRITSHWSYPNNANNKTLAVAFGASNVMQTLVTTTQTFTDQRTVDNRNSASSQVCINTGATSFGPSSTAATTTAINTANAVVVNFNGTLGSGSDTITLEAWTIEVFYKL